MESARFNAAHTMKPSTSNAVESSKPASSTCRVKQYQEIKDDIPVPAVIALGDPAPPELIDVIRCQCRAQGKKCSTAACSYKKEHLACTSYCYYAGEDGCHNPFTKKQDVMEESDRNGIVKRMPILMLLKRREMRMNLM